MYSKILFCFITIIFCSNVYATAPNKNKLDFQTQMEIEQRRTERTAQKRYNDEHTLPKEKVQQIKQDLQKERQKKNQQVVDEMKRPPVDFKHYVQAIDNDSRSSVLPDVSKQETQDSSKACTPIFIFSLFLLVAIVVLAAWYVYLVRKRKASVSKRESANKKQVYNLDRPDVQDKNK
jgi:hypothetical protein